MPPDPGADAGLLERVLALGDNYGAGCSCCGVRRTWGRDTCEVRVLVDGVWRVDQTVRRLHVLLRGWVDARTRDADWERRWRILITFDVGGGKIDPRDHFARATAMDRRIMREMVAAGAPEYCGFETTYRHQSYAEDAAGDIHHMRWDGWQTGTENVLDPLGRLRPEEADFVFMLVSGEGSPGPRGRTVEQLLRAAHEYDLDPDLLRVRGRLHWATQSLGTFVRDFCGQTEEPVVRETCEVYWRLQAVRARRRLQTFLLGTDRRRGTSPVRLLDRDVLSLIAARVFARDFFN